MSSSRPRVARSTRLTTAALTNCGRAPTMVSILFIQSRDSYPDPEHLEPAAEADAAPWQVAVGLVPRDDRLQHCGHARLQDSTGRLDGFVERCAEAIRRI